MDQIRGWIQVIVIPIVIALVGHFATERITEQQEEAAYKRTQAEIMSTEKITQQERESVKARAAAERQIKLLEIFGEKIFSKDSNDRKLALQLLTAIDNDLGDSLLRIISTVEGSNKELESTINIVKEQIKSSMVDLWLSLNTITAIQDGTVGPSSWQFFISVNSKDIMHIPETKYDDHDQSGSVIKESRTLRLQLEESMNIEIKGIGPDGRIAIGSYHIGKVDNLSIAKQITVPVTVIGFPRKGTFNLSFSISSEKG